ncbi:MAG: tetratricopeptide repeat protein [Rhodospirillales bacterium]|nr:tetratricopeptide repeat protein [Rhodospirillales bacterium]
MADTGDQLLREVKEDLQREQWLRLWKAYGRYVVGAITLVVLIVAGYTGYTNWRKGQLVENGHTFWLADRAATLGDNDEAQAYFNALLEDGNAGYPYLAGLRQAQILARDGDREAAVAIYDQLAGMNAVDERYRQLAALYAVILLVDDGDSTDVMARIEPLLAGDWRHSAMEMKGLLEIRDGETAAAAATFEAIIADPNTPITLRNRASELLAIAGGRA